MKLTDEEKRILDGGKGDIARRCMEFLVNYGEAVGAERLIDIDGTVTVHPGTFWVHHYAFSENELWELVERGEKFKVPVFADKCTLPGFIFDGYEDCGVEPFNSSYFRDKCFKSLEPWIRLGMVPIFSCAGYLVSSYLPRPRQHCAWVESSAIPWANAILGARTNFDGCFQVAYIGKVPCHGFHLDENRKATIVIRCDSQLSTYLDYELFGWVVGEICGLEVPAMVGIGNPNMSQLVRMNSTLNLGGQVQMYHIVGITPEAPTLEVALGGKRPKLEAVITKKDLRQAYLRINAATSREVDFVYLGCPHYNIVDLQKVARILEGKKCKVPLWVMTNPATFKIGELMGIRDIIQAAGGALLSGTCPGLLGGKMPPARVMATDSAKQAYYITGFAYSEPLQVWYGSMEDCLEAAITGKWPQRKAL